MHRTTAAIQIPFLGGGGESNGKQRCCIIYGLIDGFPFACSMEKNPIYSLYLD